MLDYGELFKSVRDVQTLMKHPLIVSSVDPQTDEMKDNTTLFLIDLDDPAPLLRDTDSLSFLSNQPNKTSMI